MPPVVLADLVGLIEALMPVLLGIGWVVWQVISAVQANDKNPKPAPARPAADGEEPAGGKQGELRSEVDEFLRRLKDPDAAEAEPRQPPKRPREDRPAAGRRDKPRRPRIEVLVDDEPATPAEPPPRRVAATQATPANRPVESKVAEQASKLSQRVSHADDRAEARIHEKFDHKLGSLAAQDAPASDLEPPPAPPPLDGDPAAAAPAGPTPAESIAAMLREPDNVRNAVILNEILRRPSI